jgi:putative membrane protein
MTPTLSADDHRAVQERIQRLEARTGAQVVAAVVGRSDAYPELPLQAFVGVATATAAALALAAAFRLVPASRALAIAAPIGIVVAGLLAAIASGIPDLARVLLSKERARREVRQHAKELFLDRECFATAGRRAVVVVVSLLERRIEILTDRGVRDRLPDAALAPVVAAMVAPLREGRTTAAVLAGLDALEPLLVAAGFAGGGGANELPDEVTVEAGA